MSHPIHNAKAASVFQRCERRETRWAEAFDEKFEKRWKPRCRNEEQWQHLKNACEIALENQADQLGRPKNMGGIGFTRIGEMNYKQIVENISTADIAPHAKLSLGIVMYVMPRLYLESLFGIQPMALSTAPIFYLTKTYEDAKVPGSAGDRLDIIAQRNETYAGGRKFFEAGTGDGGTVNFDLGDAGTLSHQVYINGTLTTVAFTIGVGAGAGGVDQFQFGVAPALGVEIVISYTGYAEGDTPRRIKSAMTSQTVTAEDSTLRFQMSVQAMQDAQSYHGLDLDEIMTMILAEELIAEFEANALKRVFIQAQGGNFNFNTAGYLPGDTSSADRKEYDRGIYKSITYACNAVYTLKGVNPNWIVGGVGAIEKLEELMDFEHIKNAGDPLVSEIQHRVEVGVLTGSGGYRVYKDARMPNDKLLLGYKGMEPFDAGFIICPHTMYATDLMPDPNATMEMTRGMLYRAGTVFADARQYATVTLV